jgi:hypothetical protein
MKGSQNAPEYSWGDVEVISWGTLDGVGGICFMIENLATMRPAKDPRATPCNWAGNKQDMKVSRSQTENEGRGRGRAKVINV